MDDLLIKYVLGEADPSEQAEIQRWLAADERNRKRLRQYLSIWDMSDHISPAAPDWQEAYSRFRQRVEHGPLTGTEHEQRGRKANVFYRLGSGWQIAAFLTGFLCFAAVLYVLRKREPGPGARPAVVTVSRPGPDTLPDGSVVKLDPNTTISYSFGRQTADRIVYLKGQAFFSVAADPSKPFVVHVSDLTINVLGTSFAVRQAGDSTTVEIATGTVEVSRGMARRVIHGGDTLRAYPHSDALLVTGGSVRAVPGMYAVPPAPHAMTSPAGRLIHAADSTNHQGDRRDIIRSILRDIAKEKIVLRPEDISSFGLDNEQFVVNDRQMPEKLLVQFRSKYIGPDRQGYYYGPVKVVGHGYFFTKEEIYDR